MPREPLPPMTVAALIAALQALNDPDRLVVRASEHGDGYGASPMYGFSLGAYSTDEGRVGIDVLTDELRKDGYSDEDVLRGPDVVPAVIL